MRVVATVLLLAVLLVPLAAYSQIVSPRPGVEMPQAYFDRVAEDRDAFQFQKAWIQKTQRAKEAREKFLSKPQPHGLTLADLPDHVRHEVGVAGTAFVPVMMGKFSNTGADPYAVASLQTKLFGPSASLTMTDLYDEMSYSALNVTGTVYPWVTVSNIDTYYEGGCNGLCGSANTGQFILELLQANDPGVDFGIYDNDGPDGVPNSGDDDGFVDFIAIVHPEIGGECGSPNLWSHRWVVTGWPQFAAPWTTNDPAAGGGNIRVLDYTMMPALGSGNGCGTGITEIGVYCHEFGHAFGLPDFYDTNGGGQGIGEWGLMGSGNWQLSTGPVHMMSYSKAELGWVLPTVVDYQTQPYTINNLAVNSEAYQLNVYEEKFSRKNFTPIAGAYSMHCGLTTAEASARVWAGGSGYGNGWDECIQREFAYDGTDPVTFEYDYSYDTESAYDYAYAKIEVNGTTTTLATYDGAGSGHAVIDLTPYLTSSGATTYTLFFQFTSDFAWADEDGLFNSGANGPYKVDNVSVVGGGENYFTDFEMYEDGWCYDFAKNGHEEYFLVENRNGAGAQFDQFLNGEGLIILHVEDDVMNSSLGNSGGGSNTTTRGVAVQEADGLNHLNSGVNRGDAGDPFPGTSGNMSFNNGTTPNSLSHNNLATMVLVENISAAGASMTADMRAGRFAPTLTSIVPNTADNGQVITINDLLGNLLVKGGTFCLRDVSMTEYPGSNEQWIGKQKVTGDLDLNGVPVGVYDVVWKAPDGQEAVLVGGFTVTSDVTAIGDLPGLTNALGQNHPNPFNPTTTIAYSIESQGQVTLKVYNVAGELVRTLVDDVQTPRTGGFSVMWDGRNDVGAPVASGVYLYKLTAGSNFESVRKLVMLK